MFGEILCAILCTVVLSILLFLFCMCIVVWGVWTWDSFIDGLESGKTRSQQRREGRAP
jgi:hypothetical protein